MRSENGILRQVKQRLLVLAVGLAVPYVSAVLVVSMWMGHLYRARWVILWGVGVASASIGLWLISSGRSKAVFVVKRILPRGSAAMTGLTALTLLGMHLPGFGLLWSPLPWEPRELNLAQQKLFWVLGPPIYGIGLWLLDLVRFEALRLTEKRLVIPIVALVVLLTFAVLANDYLYTRLDHGTGG